MKNISIKLKLLIIIFCSMALVSFMVFGFSIKSIYDLSNDNIESYKTNEYKNKEQELHIKTFFENYSLENIDKNELRDYINLNLPNPIKWYFELYTLKFTAL